MFVLGILVGAVLLITTRFVIYKPNIVHYHANFALYINGVRDEFKGPGYYEEVQACSSSSNSDPRTHAHLHDNVNDVLHVHASGTTWGQFFANIGYALSDTMIQTNSGLYVNDQGGKLSFRLNNKPVDVVTNRTVGKDDVLLVSYGNESASALQTQYDSIAHTALAHDQANDPATCSGSKPLTFSERLKKALSIGTP